MNREEAFNRFRINDDIRQELQSKANTHLHSSYASGITEAGNMVGYSLSPVIVNDSRVLEKLGGKAKRTALSIQQTYNRMLKRKIEEFPDTLSENEYRERLDPFFRTVIHKYNGKVLAPYLSAWSQQQAVRDFFSVNEIQALWHIEPKTTKSKGSECEIALTLVPIDTKTASQFEFPAHPRCPHRLKLSSKPKELPNQSTLWVGRDSQAGNKSAIELFRDRNIYIAFIPDIIDD